MILKAHAKINLHLDVGPKRKDGYHSLKTIFQEISLHDSLRFQATGGAIRLRVSPKGLPTGKTNLVVRALERLKKSLRGESGMQIHLTKRIPIGAGLGGGSSDAAAALWAGWRLWKGGKGERGGGKVPPPLLRCARELGADVPFFLSGGTARAEGIGDRLTPLQTPPKRWLVLVYPRIHVSTKAAYQLLDAGPRKKTLGRRFNSFEPAVFKKFPEIARVKQSLVEAGCSEVMMSGSGSAVFGFVKSRAAGKTVLSRLRKRPWDVYLTSFL